MFENYIDTNSKASWAPDYLLFIGNVYYVTFREEKALDIYEKFIRLYPNNEGTADVYFKRAICLQELSQKDKAVEAYNDFAEKFPGHPDAAEARRRAGLIRYTH